MTKPIFTEDNIQLNVQLSNKYDAIVRAGTLLYDLGYVTEDYIKAMIDREQVISTYVGNNISIPHGVDGSDQEILHTGIVLLQVPEGVSFGKDKLAYLIIGIAGKNDEHMDLLMNISLVCCEMENVVKLIQARSKKEIIDLFEFLSDEELFYKDVTKKRE